MSNLREIFKARGRGAQIRSLARLVAPAGKFIWMAEGYAGDPRNLLLFDLESGDWRVIRRPHSAARCAAVGAS